MGVFSRFRRRIKGPEQAAAPSTEEASAATPTADPAPADVAEGTSGGADASGAVSTADGAAGTAAALSTTAGTHPEESLESRPGMAECSAPGQADDTGAAAATGIPKQSSAEQAADNDPGENARR